MFEKIYGYKNVKEELATMIDWFINRDKYKKMDVVIPKGIILYGPPGCGKTLFMKEIKNRYGKNVYIINGDSQRPIEEIDKAFDASLELDFEIILIDELDLLLRDDHILVRKLQTSMDGLKIYDNVLVIATANRIREINDPLLRPGRFDRSLFLNQPSKKDRHEILKNILDNKNITLSEMDMKFLAELFYGLSCAEILAVINDCILRNSDKKITLEMIEQSFNNTNEDNEFIEGQRLNKYIATHEAGHALLIYKNKDFFTFYRARVGHGNNIGGFCRSFEIDEDDSSIEKSVAQIEIKLGGYLANKIINHYTDGGSSDDLTRAVYLERCLVNTMGQKGIKYVLRKYDEHARNETEQTCSRNEKIIRRELRRIERRVSKYIRENKEKIIEVANLLQEKGIVDRFEFERIMTSR